MAFYPRQQRGRIGIGVIGKNDHSAEHRNCPQLVVRRTREHQEAAQKLLGIDWGPNLQDPSPNEPLSRKAHMDDGAYTFLFRFAVLATIFLLALSIAYLEH